MASWPEDLTQRRDAFAERYGVALVGQIGFGFDGNVFETDRKSAVKFLKYRELYVRERDVYLRLQARGVRKVRDCAVPILLNADDELLAIEMSIVEPPYVLDFAGARLDEPHDFPPEIRAAWQAEKQEQFEEHWPEVQAILWAFQQLGIYLGDVNPRNIRLAE